MRSTNQDDGLWPAYDAERDRELDGITKKVVALLQARGVELTGRESSIQLADMLSAVERFDAAVAEAGGDRAMIDAGALAPDDDLFVLPRRAADESPARYAERVLRAAQRLGS